MLFTHLEYTQFDATEQLRFKQEEDVAHDAYVQEVKFVQSIYFSVEHFRNVLLYFKF